VVNLAHFTRSQLSENLFNKIYRAAGIKYAFLIISSRPEFGRKTGEIC
jgi:hypothetical protein